MRTRSRGLAAALATAALVLAHAAPIAADTTSFARDAGDRPNSVPLVIDALLLRPTGLMLTVVGAVFYVFPVAPMVAITRPTDIFKPLSPLVARPARFTFSDPLGSHP